MAHPSLCVKGLGTLGRITANHLFYRIDELNDPDNRIPGDAGNSLPALRPSSGHNPWNADRSLESFRCQAGPFSQVAHDVNGDALSLQRDAIPQPGRPKSDPEGMELSDHAASMHGWIARRTFTTSLPLATLRAQ